jgi:DNA-directed RNA polymerase specialized sigma24 family protein
MQIDSDRIRKLLYRIVCLLTSDREFREDLYQEAILHLWLVEERHPGQSASWYLQNCKFHLQNYIAKGRSVDSPKRRNGRLSAVGNDEKIGELLSQPESDDTLLGQVSARDIISQLSSQLTPFEQSVLGYLAEGLKAREIAVQLNVSHPTVIKHRRKIASMAIKLGIPPVAKYSRNHSRAVAERSAAP